MNRIISTISIATLLAAALVLGGCAKKVTKATPMPEEQPKPKVEAPVEQPPVQRETFDTVDPDAAAKAVLQTVYFEYDKSDLKQETLDRLTQIGRFLTDNSSVSVLIEGHADERGSSEYNMGLGDRRARAVSDWLVSYGISKNRLETTSYGRERPAFPNCGSDEPCHAKNRRAEFKVLKK
jgi:peptidoglycan-associated lipoprotein